MEASILIVTKQRAKELEVTLNILNTYISHKKHEVLVFIDGCKETQVLMQKFSWVKWFSSTKSIGASPARNVLYKKASGTYFIGFDDDAHPLSFTFVTDVVTIFNENPNIGIVAFEEIKGVFKSDVEALSYANKEYESYLTNDFIGCGFAITKKAYTSTNGFPLWMSIYGEETCVALEVLKNDFEILYTNSIKVNHRVDLKQRAITGKNYYRFQRQLTNTINFYLVYYKRPYKKVARAIFHNLKKYAFSNWSYFKNFMVALLKVVINLPKTLKYRNPIEQKQLDSFKKLKALKY